jgi:hypothetical protein
MSNKKINLRDPEIIKPKILFKLKMPNTDNPLNLDILNKVSEIVIMEDLLKVLTLMKQLKITLVFFKKIKTHFNKLQIIKMNSCEKFCTA